MTDIVKLAYRLQRRIRWQEIPEELTSADLIEIICDAIRMLYVISGRTFQFSENMFTTEPEASSEETESEETEEASENTETEEENEDGLWFTADLELDEQEWILLESEISFYNMALSNVDDLQSYTTDAMAVTHGDKPYKNIKATVEDRQARQAVVWTRMVRFNQLGVSG